MKIKNLIEQVREAYDIEKGTEEDLHLQHLLNLPEDNYWVVMDLVPFPTQQAIYNFGRGVYFEGFISRKCARSYRKISDCKECTHYFDCLNEGESIILKEKGLNKNGK